MSTNSVSILQSEKQEVHHPSEFWTTINHPSLKGKATMINYIKHPLAGDEQAIQQKIEASRLHQCKLIIKRILELLEGDNITEDGRMTLQVVLGYLREEESILESSEEEVTDKLTKEEQVLQQKIEASMLRQRQLIIKSILVLLIVGDITEDGRMTLQVVLGYLREAKS